jgi:hypothetical protein
MQLKFVAIATLLFCLPAAAEPLTQGNGATVSGRAHLERSPFGTYIHVERPGSTPVAGFVSLGDGGAYPNLYELEGRTVAITGVVVWDGLPLIIMTDPDQLRVAG